LKEILPKGFKLQDDPNLSSIYEDLKNKSQEVKTLQDNLKDLKVALEKLKETPDDPNIGALKK